MNNLEQRVLITIVGALLADLIERDSEPTLKRMNNQLVTMFNNLGAEADDAAGEEAADDTR